MKLTSVFVCLAATVNAALQYKGVDWSSLLIEEAGGKKYQTSAGASVTFEALLKANGVNSVRQRLWVKPADGNYNLAYNVKLGQRAKAAGLKIFLDLHYSDSWADPAHQVCNQAVDCTYPVLSLTPVDSTLWVANRYRKSSLESLQPHSRSLQCLCCCWNSIRYCLYW